MEQLTNLKEVITSNQTLTSIDATAQLGEALGLDDAGVYNLFKGLENYDGDVLLSVDQVTGKAIQIQGRKGQHMDFWYLYDAETGEAEDLTVNKLPTDKTKSPPPEREWDTDWAKHLR